MGVNNTTTVEAYQINYGFTDTLQLHDRRQIQRQGGSIRIQIRDRIGDRTSGVVDCSILWNQ